MVPPVSGLDLDLVCAIHRARHTLTCSVAFAPQGLSDASSLMSRREEARLARLQKRNVKQLELFDD